jgi:hypothetical protein
MAQDAVNGTSEEPTAPADLHQELMEITQTARGHFRVTDASGEPIGRIDGDFGVGFEARTPRGRLLGLFGSAEDAAMALEARRSEGQVADAG